MSSPFFPLWIFHSCSASKFHNPSLTTYTTSPAPKNNHFLSGAQNLSLSVCHRLMTHGMPLKGQDLSSTQNMSHLSGPHFALTQSMVSRSWTIAHDSDATDWVNAKHGMPLKGHDLSSTQNMSHLSGPHFALTQSMVSRSWTIAHDSDATDWAPLEGHTV